ncbi:MAG: efflux RND transporter periplasmic adaptor subunit [Candidatus Krumholzibacteria bacterium]|jgi:Cu(I)/Ag(I) efflux system membrane fusion protein|nr:efflux RND transporter periplasmic adaptor subunit [Candidatus Krumholzibacteria bacterium]MDP6669501.1 efflux RND transporter periplasmic adaptor subunit [Candidatus Krumholzibacteria bacterium]MDP6798161.1 efflux RND transporter periplasmic adaptor subunit [Candidatus Krumholzibacteria bacterium]MDP7021992.1 efflux RND transporter periplasmic adaptor subunit [Candidatus Krumholzibacteria bacterium]
MKKILIASAFLLMAMSPALSAEEWTCSMHPQIRQPEPGLCPLCAMDLIPVSGSSSELGPRQLKLSERAEALAEIQTSRVRRDQAERELQLYGKVAVDETRRSRIAAWTSGRIEKLHIDFLGAEVHKGEPLADIYSPELISAQEELFQSLRSGNADAAREKLRLLGLDKREIASIEEAGRPRDAVTIRANLDGVVLEMPSMEGAYVQTGSPLFTVADLSRVWVQLEAYEKDLPWIRAGQEVSFQTESWPGEVFHGTVAFLDPMLNETSRTLRLRVEADNPGGKLKPGLFVRARLLAPFGDSHSLLIPASAPLLTGRRAVVYVSKGQGLYEGREVELGPRAGDHYVVLSGLSEGEKVVTRGNFKIDSSLQILAKPSMMSMDEKQTPAAFLQSLDPLYESYFKVAESLSLDRVPDLSELKQSLSEITTDFLGDHQKKEWDSLSSRLESALEEMGKTKDLGDSRSRFEPLSYAMIDLAVTLGGSGNVPVYEFHCPMAFDWKGSDWLQGRDGVENPYFGSQMYRCGSRTTVHVEGAK